MDMRLVYHYAEIDQSDNMCIGVHTGTHTSDDPNWVEIPVYDDVFMYKYYDWDSGKWFYDSAMTQEFIYS